MGAFKDRMVEELRAIPSELLHGMRSRLIEEPMREACEEERQRNMVLTATAMLDAGLADDKVTYELQKFWDLRRSETMLIIDEARGLIAA